MPEDKQKQLTAFAQMMELLMVPPSERSQYLSDAEQLMDLGWVSNYIDFRMIDRFRKGLVPKYESYQSVLDYRRALREEDLEREKAERAARQSHA